MFAAHYRPDAPTQWAVVLDEQTLAPMRRALRSDATLSQVNVSPAALAPLLDATADVHAVLTALLSPQYATRLAAALRVLESERGGKQPFKQLQRWLEARRATPTPSAITELNDASTMPAGFDVPMPLFTLIVWQLVYAHARAARTAALETSSPRTRRALRGEDDEDEDVRRGRRHELDRDVEFKLSNALLEDLRLLFVSTDRRRVLACARIVASGDASLFACVPPELRAALVLVPRQTRDQVAHEFARSWASARIGRKHSRSRDGVYDLADDDVVRPSVPFVVRAEDVVLARAEGPRVSLDARTELALWARAGRPADVAVNVALLAAAADDADTEDVSDVLFLHASPTAERLLAASCTGEAPKAKVIRVVVPEAGQVRVHVPVEVPAGPGASLDGAAAIRVLAFDAGSVVVLAGALVVVRQSTGLACDGDSADVIAAPSFGDALRRAHQRAVCKRSWLTARVRALERREKRAPWRAGSQQAAHAADRLHSMRGVLERLPARKAQVARAVRREVADDVIRFSTEHGVRLIFLPKFSYHGAAGRRAGGVRSSTRELFATIAHASLRSMIVNRARKHGIAVLNCSEAVRRACVHARPRMRAGSRRMRRACSTRRRRAASASASTLRSALITRRRARSATARTIATFVPQSTST